MNGHHRYRQRFLEKSDFESLLEFRNSILSQLTNRDHYVREHDEHRFIMRHLGTEGKTIGIFNKEQLIAYAMLGLPAATSPENLGSDAGLPESEWHLVANIASCMVHPDHRGKHFQQHMLRQRIGLARRAGRRYCVSMTSLSNYPSRHNLFKSGFYISRVGLIDHILQRHLMLLDMRIKPTFDISRSVTVDAEDYEQQVRLTQGGYWGIGEHSDSGSQRPTYIRFAIRSAEESASTAKEPYFSGSFFKTGIG